MKFIAIIPARAGSVRLPNKNLQTIEGIPLVVRALHQAQRCEVFEEILVTTDSDAIVDACRQTPLLHRLPPKFVHRPEHLAGPRATSMDVARHAAGESNGYDAVVLLQPTSPLREEMDIVNCAQLLMEGAWDAVVSMTDVAPGSVYSSCGGALYETHSLLRPNGAIYALRSRMMMGDTWFPDRTRCYYMDPKRSIDIDTIVDLEAARGAVMGMEALRA